MHPDILWSGGGGGSGWGVVQSGIRVDGWLSLQWVLTGQPSTALPICSLPPPSCSASHSPACAARR